MIRHGEDKHGNRLTPEQVEDAKRRKAELEGQLEELRRRLERLKRGRITAWLPREAPRPVPSARSAEGRAPQPPAPPLVEKEASWPSPQPTPPTAPQPAPGEERQRLWELFSATLAALRSCFNFHIVLQVVTAISVYRRYVTENSRCGAPGVALNAPKPDEGPSGVRGNRDEAMTVNNMNLYES